MARPLCEVRVFSRRHRFAGTLDVLGHWPGQPVGVLLDYKTGDPNDVACDLQTAAYELALIEMIESGATAEPIEFDPLRHAYGIDGVRVPSVTRVLQRAGLVNYDHIPAPLLLAARDRGSAVHQAVHFYNEDALDVEDFRADFPSYWPYVEAWIAFRAETHFAIADVAELPTFTHIQRFAVRLKKSGRYSVEPYTNPRDYRDFLALLHAQQILERRKPQVEAELSEVA